MKRRKLISVAFVAAVLAWAASARAVDGTIEINQAKVLAAGGFPFVISTTNTSYRLTGSLTVSSNVDGIDVNASHVTIDMNGFSIVGPGSATSIGAGINGTSQGALTVENGGLIIGFNFGVITGNNGIVRNVHANGDNFAIETGSSTLITGTTANGNAFSGIACNGTGCAIVGNTADGNGTCGVCANDATTGYGQNVLNGNGTNNTNGTSMGNNVCGTGTTGKVC
jgi:hypothetical protein